MITLIIILVVIFLFVIWIVSMYNSLVILKNKIKEAFSTMDVYLKKRYDLIPNLVNTVKGYAAHETGTLEKVISARNSAATAQTTAQKAEYEKELSGALRQLFALAEAYPELKADTQFLELQKTLQGMEGEIANSRKYYNGIVNAYNNKIMVIPSSIIAKMFNFTEETYFEVDDEIERKNVKVEF